MFFQPSHQLAVEIAQREVLVAPAVVVVVEVVVRVVVVVMETRQLNLLHKETTVVEVRPTLEP